jgi:hypothetical protein
MMTVQEMVDKFGEVRITRIERPFMRKAIDAANNVVETAEVVVAYEVKVRDRAAVEEATLDKALGRIK